MAMDDCSKVTMTCITAGSGTCFRLLSWYTNISPRLISQLVVYVAGTNVPIFHGNSEQEMAGALFSSRVEFRSNTRIKCQVHVLTSATCTNAVHQIIYTRRAERQTCFMVLELWQDFLLAAIANTNRRRFNHVCISGSKELARTTPKSGPQDETPQVKLVNCVCWWHSLRGNWLQRR